MNKLIILVAVVLYGCGGSKEIVKTVTVTDSLYVKKYDSLARTVSEMKRKHARELADARKTQVRFKEIEKPVIKIDSSCNRDSLVAAIRTLEKYISGLKNKVTVLKDGSTVYEGQIKNFRSHINSLSHEVNELWYKHDDSVRVLSELRAELFKTKTEKQKYAQKSLWWLWFLVGVVVGYVISGWLKKKVNKYF